MSSQRGNPWAVNARRVIQRTKALLTFSAARLAVTGTAVHETGVFASRNRSRGTSEGLLHLPQLKFQSVDSTQGLLQRCRLRRVLILLGQCQTHGTHKQPSQNTDKNLSVNTGKIHFHRLKDRLYFRKTRNVYVEYLIELIRIVFQISASISCGSDHYR